MWAPTSEPDDEAMNSSTWYFHQPIDIHSRSLLSDRQLTERATWRAALRGERAKHHK
jgi:hypothetical protein